MNLTYTHTHRNGHSTEWEAAQKASRRSTSIKNQILQRLSEESDGLTPDEFCQEVGGLINTIRRRFTDLWKEGKIRHHPEGKTRLNSAQNECVVWVLGEDESRKPSRVKQMQQEISYLRSILKLHGIDPYQQYLLININQ